MQEQIMAWCAMLEKKLKETFGARLYFFGLQGSCRRGEAGPDSDIDLVVIFDQINVQTLCEYQAVLGTMPCGEKACGFVCGWAELLHWPVYDALQLFYDTQPIYGTLEAIKKRITRERVAEAVAIGAANLYHAACHQRVFQPYSEQPPASLYKEGMFLLRTYALYVTGTFAKTHRELEQLLTGKAKQLCRQWGRTKAATQQLKEERDKEYENIIKFCQILLNDIKY